MARRVVLELELPDDEAVAHLGDDEMALKAREALVMELLREHTISQGKTAKLLGISRHQLFDLMTQYQVPVIDMTPEELEVELRTPWPVEDDKE